MCARTAARRTAPHISLYDLISVKVPSTDASTEYGCDCWVPYYDYCEGAGNSQKQSLAKPLAAPM